MLWDYIRFDFWRRPFSQRLGADADQETVCRLHHPSIVEHADYLSGVDSVRHS